MDHMDNQYCRPGFFSYLLARIASFFVANIIFCRRFLRNELKSVRGPCVVIANHECALDFVNLIGATRRPMTFVISNSFYQSLPVKGIMDRMHVIPKQQFQTGVNDLKRMKAVIDSGQILVIYPAGLMSEDGLSTPIPQATCKFLKWLKADVYMARIRGSYFVMPKWAKGLRPGRTTMDIYRLFEKNELSSLPLSEIRERTERALLFDAYREQEALQYRYARNNDIRGLESVLYQCPQCGGEFTVAAAGSDTLCCSKCGYRAHSDAYGFLHTESGETPLRYVSDWSLMIQQNTIDTLRREPDYSISSPTRIHMIDPKRCNFTDVGEGVVSLDGSHFHLRGKIRNRNADIAIPIANIPTLPFKPGIRIELQNGPEIYRCVLDDGRMAMKFIRVLKAFYQIHTENESLR